MSAHEIPRQQWPLFFGEFGYSHFGWDVVLEQKHRRGCKRTEADRHFLQALTADCTDGREQITIVLGSPFAPHEIHVVDNPRKVRVASGHEQLEIDCGDGITVVVHVRRTNVA